MTLILRCRELGVSEPVPLYTRLYKLCRRALPLNNLSLVQKNLTIHHSILRLRHVTPSKSADSSLSPNQANLTTPPLCTPPCPPVSYLPVRLSPPTPGWLRKRPSRNRNSRKSPSPKTSAVYSRSCRRTKVHPPPPPPPPPGIDADWGGGG